MVEELNIRTDHVACSEHTFQRHSGATEPHVFSAQKMIMKSVRASAFLNYTEKTEAQRGCELIAKLLGSTFAKSKFF